MVVDDEPSARGLLRRVNSHFGFETIEARDGEEGWELYVQDKPDLTISDIYMPKMNGLQLLSKIKKDDENAKVILITGFSHFRLLLQTNSHLRPDGFLEKPFDIEDLGRVMKKFLNDMNPTPKLSDD
ncbi:MAG: response regulator [bacterium]